MNNAALKQKMKANQNKPVNPALQDMVRHLAKIAVQNYLKNQKK
mgnify:CR=1 FL=1